MSHWDPFRKMDVLRREMDHLFDTLGDWKAPRHNRFAFLPGRSAQKYPLLNLNEDKESFYIEALAPGIKPDTLEVTVVGNRLTISGEKDLTGAEIKAETYHRNERNAGKFMRMLELPHEIDDSKVKADYKNGLLYISLPKSEKAKPKQISVTIR